MTKKEKLIDYLLSVKSEMEREQGRVIKMITFARFVDLPLRTVTSMFDPDDPRVPIEANARKIAIALYSNRIMHILGYEEIDPFFLQMKKYYDQLPPEEQANIVAQMQSMIEPGKAIAVAG
jgi:hypothetical protein